MFFFLFSFATHFPYKNFKTVLFIFVLTTDIPVKNDKRQKNYNKDRGIIIQWSILPDKAADMVACWETTATAG